MTTIEQERLLKTVSADREAAEGNCEHWRKQAENLRLIEDYLKAKLAEDDDAEKLNLAGRTQFDSLLAVLKRAKQTMTTYQLADEIVKFGYPARSNGDGLRASLYSVMAKHPETFKRIGPGI